MCVTSRFVPHLTTTSGYSVENAVHGVTQYVQPLKRCQTTSFASFVLYNYGQITLLCNKLLKLHFNPYTYLSKLVLKIYFVFLTKTLDIFSNVYPLLQLCVSLKNL